MESLERFNKTSLPDKKAFYSNLNIKKNIKDVDYGHAQKVFEEFKTKNLGEYHNLYVQSDTLLLVDLFENFRNKYIQIYELNPDHFLSAPGLAQKTWLKKARVNLELLTDINMLLMVENLIIGGIWQAIHRYAKANDKYMKSYNKLSYLMYLYANDLYG